MSTEDPWIADLENLKRTPRTGWFRIGISHPESVAEHSYATGLIAWRLAREAGLDAERVMLMALLHDFHEARLGDIPTPSKRHLPDAMLAEAETDVIEKQWREACPRIVELMAELRANESEEARLVHAADKIELLLQARRYRAQGNTEADEFVAGLESDPRLKRWLRSSWLDGPGGADSKRE